jgi:ferredoxin-NADP reductase
MIDRAAWHVGTVTATAAETPNARRIRLDVPGWPGNIAGQHLDVRLTAPGGYQASRSYSIASAGSGSAIELAVDKLPTGEVSPFLVDVLMSGDQVELRGPLGGWFVWEPPQSDSPGPLRPVQLIAGGSGVVPFIAMISAHQAAADPTDFRLLYAVRTPEDVFYTDELDQAQQATAPLRIDTVYSRSTPPGWPVPAGRITRDRLAEAVIPPDRHPRLFVCGSTRFTEQILTWLSELGYDTSDVRAERFGGNA